MSLQSPAGERMLEVHRFPEYWFSRKSRLAVSPHQSLRKKVGVMARAPVPYLRVAVCSAWIVLMLLTFAILDHVSARSLVFLVAALVVPPSVFLAVWSEAPPRTVAELLHATEDRR